MTANVEAKAEDPERTTREQLEVMLQNLLTEHFKLKFHRGKREVQGFDLLLVKTGHKLIEANPT